MAKCIVFTYPDALCLKYRKPLGQMGVVTPTRELIAELGSEAAAISRCLVRSIPPGALNITVVDRAALPKPNRVVGELLRDAWRVGNPSCYVDLPVAREITLDRRIRRPRTPLLVKADHDIERALDRNDVALVPQLRAYRQALRDLPTTAKAQLDALTTAAELEAWQPTWPTDPAPQGGI